MGKYVVSMDENLNSIKIELSGFFTDNDANNFVTDFVELSNKVKTENTYLTFDCGKLFLYPCDAKYKLRDVFKLYKNIGYKLIRMKLYKPQKELARKFTELAEEIGLNLETMFIE